MNIKIISTVHLPIPLIFEFLLKKYSQINLRYRVNNVANSLSLIQKSNGAISTNKLQCETNTSRKTLERAFMNCIGINPKLYSEITRFNAAKKWLDHYILKQKLSGLAYDLDFCSGSHFAADFKRFANISPTEYLHSAKSDRIPAF